MQSVLNANEIKLFASRDARRSYFIYLKILIMGHIIGQLAAVFVHCLYTICQYTLLFGLVRDLEQRYIGYKRTDGSI